MSDDLKHVWQVYKKKIQWKSEKGQCFFTALQPIKAFWMPVYSFKKIQINVIA